MNCAMKLNISMVRKFISNFSAEPIEYLEDRITRQGIQPIRNKFAMNNILNIKDPKSRNEEPVTPVYWYGQLLS
jgi:hypothetical protein